MTILGPNDLSLVHNVATVDFNISFTEDPFTLLSVNK